MFCLEESRAAGSTADTADSIGFALSKLPSVACCSKKIIAGSCSHWIYTHRAIIKHNVHFALHVVTNALIAAHRWWGRCEPFSNVVDIIVLNW